MQSTVERVAIATRGVRFPASLADLLSWADYNRADRQSLRELHALPWRNYFSVGDVVEEIRRLAEWHAGPGD
jgi:hypothetical protein